MAEEKIVAVRFPPLFKSVRTFLSDVLGIISKKLGEPSNWPKAHFQHIEFRSPSSCNTSWVEKCNIGAILRQIWPEAAAMDSYKAACANLEVLKGEGKAIGHGINDLGAAYLGPLVQGYLSRLDPSFDELHFSAIYEDLEAYLASDLATARVFLQLQSLTGDLDRLELDKDHSIIKLDENTARHIWSRVAMADVPAYLSVQIFGHPKITPMPGQFVLEAKFKFRKTEALRFSAFMYSEVRRSSSAVRLVQPGSGPVKLLGYDHLGFFPEAGGPVLREEYGRGRFSYSLNASVAEQMKRLWPNAFEISEQLEADVKQVATHIRIGIARYLGSFGEKVAEDRLLDYIIALEALCGFEAEAVSYRIALRVATLIGKDASERESLFETVTNGYAQRSKVAHGKTAMTEPLDASSEKLLRQLQTILLRTIHTNLSAQKSALQKQDIIKLLESAIRTQDRTALESKIRPEFL
jgi:hypothetical protein